MTETTSRGIQATLFDYFQDTEYFDLQEANELLLEHQQRDINAESIRARIYEGIDKGLFERVGKGLYTVTRKDEQGRENTCLLINGNGRDLSIFENESVDLILTDHPYDTRKSLKGGNRDFADYELFKYSEKDLSEKHRVLKSGHFCVEFLPEENGDNYEYIFSVKDMARKAGLEYYATVPWVKVGFVANTGRKSKNTENVVFFSKGKARELRPNAKEDKKYNETHTVVELEDHIPGGTTVHYSDMGGMASSSETKTSSIDFHIRISVSNEDEQRARELLDAAWDNYILDSFENSPLDIDNGGEYTIEQLFDMPADEYILRYISAKGLSFDDVSKDPVKHYMSGTKAMLPTSFEVEPVDRRSKLNKAEKPIELIKQILEYVSLEGELVLDQFAGSGAVGVASLETGRNSILIEKDPEMFEKMTKRLQLLGSMAALTPAAQDLVSIGGAALVAQDAFYRTGDRNIIYNFVKNHDIDLTALYNGRMDLLRDNSLSDEQSDSIAKALSAIGDIQLRSDDRDMSQKALERSENIEGASVQEGHPKVLECSIRGDRRFSALFAKVSIKGKEKSIEEWFQESKRTADGKKAGKGKPFDHIICPYTKDKLPIEDAADLYRGLWITYLNNHPELIEYASQFDEFSDSFKDPDVRNRQIDAYEVNPFDKDAEFFYNHSGQLSAADIIGAYIKGDREHYVSVVKAGHWYQNMATKKKAPLAEKIASAKSRVEDHQCNINHSKNMESMQEI